MLLILRTMIYIYIYIYSITTNEILPVLYLLFYYVIALDIHFSSRDNKIDIK